MATIGGAPVPKCVITRLYDNTKKGEGTDLVVKCPKKHGEPALGETIHLHSCVATLSSDFFANKSLPRSGIIQDVDTATLRECVKFMYERKMDVNPDNVAAILGAADFLCMRGLAEECFRYLEEHLDHNNHETVKDLAEKFHNQPLVDKCRTFSTPGRARDQLHHRVRKLEQDVKVFDSFASVARDVERREFQKLNDAKAQLEESLPRPIRNQTFDREIEDYNHDDTRDCFFQVLTVPRGGFNISLANVIIRKMQKQDPDVSPPEMWASMSPDLCLLWKSRQAFLQAVKNVHKKTLDNKRKYGYGKTYKEALDEMVYSFEDYRMVAHSGSVALQGTLSCGNLAGAISCLFQGLTNDSIALLKRWRRDYLAWRRQERISGDHSWEARKKLPEIFTNPERCRWNTQQYPWDAKRVHTTSHSYV